MKPMDKSSKAKDIGAKIKQASLKMPEILPRWSARFTGSTEYCYSVSVLVEYDGECTIVAFVAGPACERSAIIASCRKYDQERSLSASW